jgi:hypothetical protein
MSLRPVDVAAEFMTKQVPFIAQSYRHSEQKLVRRLSEFMPSGQVPTYNQLFNNIDKSQGIGRTEKLILKSLALQLKQQGTTEQMLPGLLGRITAEQKPESDSYFNKLFQGTRERFEDAKKWLGTLDAGENAGQ